MASVSPGYIFTGVSDPITYAKLNLLGTPTVTIGAGEVTIAMLGPLASTGRLIGSTPASAAAASMLINNTGLTLHVGNGLSFGSTTVSSSIAIGQSATAYGKVQWTYNATEASTAFLLYGLFGAAFSSMQLSKSSIVFSIESAQGWTMNTAGSLGCPGGALATNATDGFLHIKSCAGTPTGAPASFGAGTTPVVYDSSANKIWFYSGSWRGVVVL